MVESGDRVSARRFRNPVALSAWSIAAAFGAYFCSYGFRKPFTAGAYSGSSFGGLDYKVILVVAQVLGYSVSKFIGIGVVSQTRPERRAICILLLIALAWLALLMFAVVPARLASAMFFINGLAPGMVLSLFNWIAVLVALGGTAAFALSWASFALRAPRTTDAAEQPRPKVLEPAT